MPDSFQIRRETPAEKRLVLVTKRIKEERLRQKQLDSFADLGEQGTGERLQRPINPFEPTTARAQPQPITEESARSLQEAQARSRLLDQPSRGRTFGPSSDPADAEQRRQLGEEALARRQPSARAVPQPSTQPIAGTLTAEEAQTRQLEQQRDRPSSVLPFQEHVATIASGIVTDMVTDNVRGFLPEGWGGFSPTDKEAFLERSRAKTEELFRRQDEGGPMALLDAIGIGMAPAVGLSGTMTGIGMIRHDLMLAERVLAATTPKVGAAVTRGAERLAPTIREFITSERGAVGPGARKGADKFGFPEPDFNVTRSTMPASRLAEYKKASDAVQDEVRRLSQEIADVTKQAETLSERASRPAIRKINKQRQAGASYTTGIVDSAATRKMKETVRELEKRAAQLTEERTHISALRFRGDYELEQSMIAAGERGITRVAPTVRRFITEETGAVGPGARNVPGRKRTIDELLELGGYKKSARNIDAELESERRVAGTMRSLAREFEGGNEDLLARFSLDDIEERLGVDLPRLANDEVDSAKAVRLLMDEADNAERRIQNIASRLASEDSIAQERAIQKAIEEHGVEVPPTSPSQPVTQAVGPGGRKLREVSGAGGRATPPKGMEVLTDQQVLRGFREAAKKSTVAGEARAKLPSGTSRSRVTTANARWATYAESRDRYRNEWLRRYPDTPIEDAATTPARPVTETTLPARGGVEGSRSVGGVKEGDTLYWGGQSFDPARGGFLSPDPSYAAKFASQTGGEVHAVTIGRTPRIFPEPMGWQEYQQIFRKDQMFNDYDAIRIIEPNAQGESLFVRKPDVIKSGTPIEATGGQTTVGNVPTQAGPQVRPGGGVQEIAGVVPPSPVSTAPSPGLQTPQRLRGQAGVAAPPGRTSTIRPPEQVVSPVEAQAAISREFTDAVPGSPVDEAASSYLRSGDLDEFVASTPPGGDFPVIPGFAEEAFAEVGRVSGRFSDPTRLVEAIDLGHFGGAMQRGVLWPTRRTFLASLRFGDTAKGLYQQVLDRYQMTGFRIGTRSKTLREAAGDVIEHISSSRAGMDIDDLMKLPEISKLISRFKLSERQRIVGLAKDSRAWFDDMLKSQNAARVQRGQDSIKRLENYRPWVRETNLWSRLGFAEQPAKEIAQAPFPPDFIKPNRAFNPRAEARLGGLHGYEKVKDLQQLAFDYADSARKDIFYTNIIGNAKSHIRELRNMGFENSAAGVEDWIMEGFAGKLSRLSAGIRETVPPPLVSGALAIRRNLTRAVFPLNWTWNVFIQTSSGALTLKNFGPVNTLRGLEYIVSPSARQAVRQNAYSAIIKGRRGGKAALQDISVGVEKTFKLETSPIDRVEHFTNLLTNVIEDSMTGISVRAAYHDGVRKGLKGRALWEWASEGGSKTQSMYNLEDIPGVLRTREVGAIAPFQTFAFEVMNTVRELGIGAGKIGLSQKTQTERLRQLAQWVGAMVAFNAIGERYNNRQPWQLSSFVPFWALLTGGLNAGNPWNFPLPTKYVADFKRGLDDQLRHGSWKNLRKWFIQYHAASFGVPGGTQINRVLDGMEAVSSGKVTNVAGRTLFKISDDEWLKAIAQGPYSTSGGQEYIDQLNKSKGPIFKQTGIPLPSDINLFGSESSPSGPLQRREEQQPSRLRDELQRRRSDLEPARVR